MSNASQSALERAVWELQQREAITETLINYCVNVDRNDPVTLTERVFAEDGCFELGARYAVVGREELRKMFARTLAAFSATSHHLSNLRITLTDERTAQSTAYVYAWHVSVTDGKRIDLWGRYHDHLVLTAQGWRIASRRLSAAGSDGWDNPPFDISERLPNPQNPPSPAITRR
jgi:hypothetical protein